MDEDDYLSADYLKELAKLDEKNKNKFKPKSAKQKEQPKFIKLKDKEELSRKEALSTPLDSSSPGFRMLQQMGYQKGKGLGKQSAGIETPLPLTIKRGREGIGITEEDEKKEGEIIKRLKTQNNDENILQFRNRNQSSFLSKKKTRQIISAIHLYFKLKKQSKNIEYNNNNNNNINNNSNNNNEEDKKEVDQTCENEKTNEIDNENEKKIKFLQTLNLLEELKEDEKIEVPLNLSENEDDSSLPSTHFIPDLTSLPVEEKEEKFAKLVSEIRSEYCYCFYCACLYENEEDLADHCPGDVESLHS